MRFSTKPLQREQQNYFIKLVALKWKSKMGTKSVRLIVITVQVFSL